MKDEAAVAVHRSAVEHGAVGHGDLAFHAQLLEQVGQAQLGHGLVEDDAHGVLVGMGAHEHHRAVEARIPDQRARDQKLAVQIVRRARVHGPRLVRLLTIKARQGTVHPPPDASALRAGGRAH
jgi:hypothetical protein